MKINVKPDPKKNKSTSSYRLPKTPQPRRTKQFMHKIPISTMNNSYVEISVDKNYKNDKVDLDDLKKFIHDKDNDPNLKSNINFHGDSKREAIKIDGLNTKSTPKSPINKSRVKAEFEIHNDFRPNLTKKSMVIASYMVSFFLIFRNSRWIV